MAANHSYRTYAWGAVLAAYDGVSYNPEVVYVASLLHDLYFADPHAESQPHCFTLPAARRAQKLLTGRGEFSIAVAGLAVASDVEPNLGPLAVSYVFLLAVIGPMAARLAEPIADRS